MTAMEVLLVQWRYAWRAIGANDDGEVVVGHLVARYGEPHRYYHTLDHIGDCLRHLEMASYLLEKPSEAAIAVWFHDAIYDPRRGDNEDRSAELAGDVLRQAGVDGAAARRVADLIRQTAHSETRPVGNAAVVCDADLAILGAEMREFERYDTAIRREYEWVPESVYRRERGRILAGFLARPRIYQTDFFADSYEARARLNLRRALDRYHPGDEFNLRTG